MEHVQKACSGANERRRSSLIISTIQRFEGVWRPFAAVKQNVCAGETMTQREIKTVIEEVFAVYRRFSFLNRLNLPAVPKEAQLCKTIDAVVEHLDPIERCLVNERYMKRTRVSDLEVYSQIITPPVCAVTYSNIRREAFTKLIVAFKEIGIV